MMTEMKNAVVYGSGKIGRGFIGKIFAESGYRVCFLDRIQALVDGLNAAGSYRVRIVSNDDAVESVVPVHRALISTTGEALEALASCDLMATAVGVDDSDLWLACKYKALSADLEDNVVLAAAQRCKADHLVTFDEALIRKAPISAMLPKDMTALLGM